MGFTYSTKVFEKSSNKKIRIYPICQQTIIKKDKPNFQLIKMQKKTTFLFFAIGLLAFVQASPRRSSSSSSSSSRGSSSSSSVGSAGSSSRGGSVASSGSSGSFQAVGNNRDQAARDQWNQNVDNYEITRDGLIVKGRGNNRDFTQPWSKNFFDNHVIAPSLKLGQPVRNVKENSLLTKAHIMTLYLERTGPEANGKNGGPSVLNNVLTQFRNGPNRYVDGKKYEVTNYYYQGSTKKVWHHLEVNNEDQDEGVPAPRA